MFVEHAHPEVETTDDAGEGESSVDHMQSRAQ
jgi:hypothetical protein